MTKKLTEAEKAANKAAKEAAKVEPAANTEEKPKPKQKDDNRLVELEYVGGGRYSVGNETVKNKDPTRDIDFIEFDKLNPVHEVTVTMARHLLKQKSTRTKEPYFRVYKENRKETPVDELDALLAQ